MNETPIDQEMHGYMTRALDTILVPAAPTRPLKARWLGMPQTLVPLGFAAVVLAGLFLTLGSLRASQPAASPNSTSIATPVATPKAERSTAPDAVSATRARWIVTGGVLFVQPEALDFHRTAAEEVRVLAADGSVVASAAIRPAQSGEPRTCGTPDITPPLIASLPLPAAASADFAQANGPTVYRIQVREGLTWHGVGLYDLRLSPEKPCTAS